MESWSLTSQTPGIFLSLNQGGPIYEALKKAQEASFPPLHASCTFSIIHSCEDSDIFNY